MIRVGVIGLGQMGQHHVRLCSQLDCGLVGVVDADRARAKEIGEKYGVPFYTDYHDLLSHVDAVTIAVPTTLHCAVATAFLKKGVHCLVEKPISSSIEQARKMIAEAEQNQAKLAIGHIERFNPAVTALKKLVCQGKLGKILIISTRRVGPSVPRIRDVGVVIDSATHDIGVIRYLVGGDPASVFSRVGTLRHSKEDHAIVVLDYGETTACIEVNWFTPQKIRTLVATGSEGIAYLDYIEQKLVFHNSRGAETCQVEHAEPLKLEIEDFLSSIKENRLPAVDGREGMAILRIALEACSNNFSILSASRNCQVLS